MIVNCIDLEGNIRSTDGDAPSDDRREINSSYSYRAPQTDEADKERAEFKTFLEERSEKLVNAVTEDKAAMQYLKDNGAASVTVAFYTPWEKQGDFFYTYSYDL